MIIRYIDASVKFWVCRLFDATWDIIWTNAGYGKLDTLGINLSEIWNWIKIQQFSWKKKVFKNVNYFVSMSMG